MESTNQSLQRKNVGGKTERLEKLDEEVSGKQSALGQWQRASKKKKMEMPQRRAQKLGLAIMRLYHIVYMT